MPAREILVRRALVAWPYVVPALLVAGLVCAVLPSVGRGYDLPVPQAPPPGARCDQTRVQLLWHETPGEGAYRAQVARDADFEDIVVERRSQRNNVVLPRLPGGRYHWRVRRGDRVGPSSTFEVPGRVLPY